MKQPVRRLATLRMTHRAVLAGLLATATLLFAAPAFAHPDMAVTARVLFDIRAGRLAGIAQLLAFDAATSARLLARVDSDRDGALDVEEAQALATEMTTSLGTRGFFTEMLLAGRQVSLAAPIAADARIEGGHLVLSMAFAVPGTAMLQDGARLELMLRDRDLTLAFRFAPDRPLIVRGDQGRCTATIAPKPEAAFFGGLVTPDIAILACR
ncbi:DUF1007 family protein [Rhizobium sp. SL42]|uniref:DUF1007 family protein n=1 Tax=Rhizobium sp. SL42 TaxID=2806346 RepID=UPI001F2F6595|nr:DUF1007 family protein [Rhizobium sp. SL42]UJW76161.1 DUF1007 family protein [Rhizobium sp. SL42]